MQRRPLHLVLSLAGWAGFNAIVVWTMAFLAGVVVPRTVDGPHRTGTAFAVATDLALLLLFAVQHSVMARTGVKAAMRRHVPPGLERTVYVLATDGCLALLLLLWQPFGGTLWSVEGPWAVGLWALCTAGWLLAVAATWAVDHFELTGLRQAGWVAPRPVVTGGLQVRGMYAVVRHPLMTGLLVAFWATPRMGASHLLFAVASTGYVLLGVHFEERDLRRAFGPAYAAYAARVPALVPGLALPRRRTGRRVEAPAEAATFRR
jgi:protein-S-isoprenylcysteine O-methyltransferase Ste14